MRLTSFGMFAIMKRTNYKIWDWRNITDWYYQSQNIKMICGSNHSRHRLHRKSVSFWTSHGNPFYRLKESGGIENPGTQDIRR